MYSLLIFKLKIQDVIDKYTFIARDSKGNLIEDLTENDIKPTLPEPG